MLSASHASQLAAAAADAAAVSWMMIWLAALGRTKNVLCFAGE
jgi:hypothetical protein